jgi:hypothetical protein
MCPCNPSTSKCFLPWVLDQLWFSQNHRQNATGHIPVFHWDCWADLVLARSREHRHQLGWQWVWKAAAVAVGIHLFCYRCHNSSGPEKLLQVYFVVFHSFSIINKNSNRLILLK